MSSIGDHLRDLREAEHLSQSDFAEKMGVNRMTINNYETGKRNPDIDFAVRAADFFNVSLEYICGRSEYRTEHSLQQGLERAEGFLKLVAESSEFPCQLLLVELSTLLQRSNEAGISNEILNFALALIQENQFIITAYTHKEKKILKQIAMLKENGINEREIDEICHTEAETLSKQILLSSEHILAFLRRLNNNLYERLSKSR